MFLYIAIIYAVLILIVAPLWLLVDTNFKSMLLLEKGRKAKIASQHINDTMAITDSSIWYLTNDNKIFFNDYFYDQYNLENKPIKINKLLNYLAPDSKRHIEVLHQMDRSDVLMNQEVTFRVPTTGEWHTYNITAYEAPKTMRNVKRVGVLILIDDIKKEAEERKEAYRKDQISQQKNNKLTAMGNELRYSLDAIIENSKILCEQFDRLTEDKRQKYKDNIDKNAEILLSSFESKEQPAEEQTTE